MYDSVSSLDPQRGAVPGGTAAEQHRAAGGEIGKQAPSAYRT
jgi:hypothetical protein